MSGVKYRFLIAVTAILGLMGVALYLCREPDVVFENRISHDEIYSSWYIFGGGDLWAYPQILAELPVKNSELDSFIKLSDTYWSLVEAGTAENDLDFQISRDEYLNGFRNIALTPRSENLMYISYLSLKNNLRFQNSDVHPSFARRLLSSIRFLESTMYISSLENEREIYDVASKTRDCIVINLYASDLERLEMECLNDMKQTIDKIVVANSR